MALLNTRPGGGALGAVFDSGSCTDSGGVISWRGSLTAEAAVHIELVGTFETNTSKGRQPG